MNQLNDSKLTPRPSFSQSLYFSFFILIKILDLEDLFDKENNPELLLSPVSLTKEKEEEYGDLLNDNSHIENNLSQNKQSCVWL